MIYILIYFAYNFDFCDKFVNFHLYVHLQHFYNCHWSFFDFDRTLTHLRASTDDSFAELQRFQKTEGNWKGNEWRFVNSDVFIRNSMLTQQLQRPRRFHRPFSWPSFAFLHWWGIYRKWKPDTKIWHAHICRYQIINIVSIFSRR